MTRWCKRHPGAVVVGGWAVLNAVLLGVLTGYGESELALLLWAGAFVLLTLAATAVLVSSRRGPRELTDYGVPGDNGAAVVLTAFGLAAGGLMFVYSTWLVIIAAPLLLVAAVFAVRHRGRGGSSR
ncbi:hypothetical protein JW613_20725 [Streptomyces smyrnaeus]|uniref:Integral membrane protein n=1 Tax=Streptomyces smyrnaeus TaxID=1387713 RepID=A0ABS3XZ84_9ACTN|nr:hypothetical protein [Streptomyces smyrnaeus]